MAERSNETGERRPARRPRRSKYSVEKSLEGSLDNAAEGLATLLESLQRSGMVEGLSGYRTLQAVLMQQKLWAVSNQQGRVLPKFDAIARTAEKLHRVFSGYAAVMEKLSKLDEIRAPSPTARKARAEAGEGEGEASEAPAVIESPEPTK